MQFAGSRVRRYAVGSLGILAVLVLLVAFFPWNWVRGPIASIASTRLQRTVAIGHIDVDWGSPTLIAVDDVILGFLPNSPQGCYRFPVNELLPGIMPSSCPSPDGDREAWA